MLEVDAQGRTAHHENAVIVMLLNADESATVMVREAVALYYTSSEPRITCDRFNLRLKIGSAQDITLADDAVAKERK